MFFGAGGIRTPGTLAGYNSLAGSPIRPLSHRSNNVTQINNIWGNHPPSNVFRSRGDSGFRSQTSCLLSPPPPTRSRRIRPFGPFADRNDLLLRHLAEQRHPCAAYPVKAYAFAKIPGTLRFESPFSCGVEFCYTKLPS